MTTMELMRTVVSSHKESEDVLVSGGAGNLNVLLLVTCSCPSVSCTGLETGAMKVGIHVSSPKANAGSRWIDDLL